MLWFYFRSLKPVFFTFFLEKIIWNRIKENRVNVCSIASTNIGRTIIRWNISKNKRRKINHICTLWKRNNLLLICDYIGSNCSMILKNNFKLNYSWYDTRNKKNRLCQKRGICWKRRKKCIIDPRVSQTGQRIHDCMFFCSVDWLISSNNAYRKIRHLLRFFL